MKCIFTNISDYAKNLCNSETKGWGWVGIRTRKSENKQKTAYDSKIVTLSNARLSVT